MDDVSYISSYSRQQAIADGVLVDVTEQAKSCGFKIPVALTINAWTETVLWNDFDELNHKGEGQSEIGRLNDVLSMAYYYARKIEGNEGLIEVLRVDRTKESSTPQLVSLKMHIGPGDDPSPVITIMLPDED